MSTRNELIKYHFSIMLEDDEDNDKDDDDDAQEGKKRVSSLFGN